MAKFRKLPVVIEAFQWTGANVNELATWAAHADLEARKRNKFPLAPSGDVQLPLHVTPLGDGIRLVVTTINGNVDVHPGEWVICGVHGEFYPCAADIFAKTYEAL